MIRGFACFCFAAVLACGQSNQPISKTTYEGFPAVNISNGVLTLTMLEQGTTFGSVVLADDKEQLNPLWNPGRMARELAQAAGKPAPQTRSAGGHFVCVDGFGPTSAEERAAGLGGHGEARAQNYEVKSSKDGRTAVVSMTAKLPIVQEMFTRTVRMVDGENVIYVESQLESLLGFDRPANWGEHATIGSPFLAVGETVVDLSGSRSRVRDFDAIQNPDGITVQRLMPDKDFTWPMAPTLEGKTTDMRITPPTPHYIDHVTTLMDPTRQLEWVTAINTKKNLIIGYIFKREEYPWLQTWGNYPPTEKMSRGLEFASQPYDVPRRQTIEPEPLFHTPMYRWLPAKSKIGTSFLMFYAHVPAGFDKVDDVRLENGQITIQGHGGQRVTLAASRGI